MVALYEMFRVPQVSMRLMLSVSRTHARARFLCHQVHLKVTFMLNVVLFNTCSTEDSLHFVFLSKPVELWTFCVFPSYFFIIK